MSWQVASTNGIFLPQIGWHLDGRRRTDFSFVSHAHADHMARHRTVLCTPPTAQLMQKRLGGKRREIILEWGQPHVLADGTRVELHPAGHILGSAQFWAENESGRILYTGDFKLRAGFSSEGCATPRADVLIMETTFGRPRYVFPPADEVMAAITNFCREALAAGAAPILFGYSLGKAQEILRGLTGAGFEIMLHERVRRMTAVYESFGVVFPHYRALDPAAAAGCVLICPPQAGRARWLQQLEPHRTAMITGWAADRGARFRCQCDAVFPLSDHAGFDDLLAFVARVQPQLVYTVHGFAVEFARTLRARGMEAWALGRENQLELGLGAPPG